MMFDVKSADEINGTNEPAVENGQEISPNEMELLIALMDAAETQHYIDWSTFSHKPHT